MTNVSGVNKENQIVVSGDIARHYGDLAKQYRNESEGFCNSAKENAEIVASKIGEINNLVDSSIQNISNAQTIAVNAVDNQSSIAISNINLEADDIKADLEEYKSSVDTEKTNSITEIKTEGAEQINNIKKTGFYIHNDKLYYIDSNGETQEFGGGGGLEVCDIGMALFVDETKGLRRRLNGRIVDINTNTQGFLTRLKQITTLYPSLACTEEEWQTVKTMSKLGQCGKFVYNYGSDGTTVISVRLPVVVNINGLADMANAGLIKDESLPNIKATLGMASDSTPYSGAFYAYRESSSDNTSNTSTKQTTPWGIKFDASRSSSTYQDNAPVQQEAIQYPYFIQIATGQETEVDIVNTIELNKPSFFGDSKYVPTPVNNLSWLKSEGQQNAKAVYPDVYDWVLENVNKGVSGFLGQTMYMFGSADGGYYCSTQTPQVGAALYGSATNKVISATVTKVYDNGNIDISDFLLGSSYTNVGRYSAADESSTGYVTDYDYVINTADETFRLPLLNGSESLPSNTVLKTIGNTAVNTTETLTLFTASHNGFVSIRAWGYGNAADRTLTAFKNGMLIGSAGINTGSYNQGTVSFEVKRGDVITISADKTPLIYNYHYFKAVGNGSLYYYVGETVQNVDLINAGRIAEELVDVKASIDGDWTYKQLQFASSVSIPINTEGVGNVFTYDLSNYLPNDGYKYEVTISVEVNNSSFCTLGYYLPDNSWYSFAKGGHPTGGCFTAIVDSSRQVKISVINTQEGLIWARAAAYRRLGKKV